MVAWIIGLDHQYIIRLILLMLIVLCRCSLQSPKILLSIYENSLILVILGQQFSCRDSCTLYLCTANLTLIPKALYLCTTNLILILKSLTLTTNNQETSVMHSQASLLAKLSNIVLCGYMLGATWVFIRPLVPIIRYGCY